jgi:Asp-tRNA(Asn)/Glu-tRNA(Gln) amidotransferase A subunit family amidase
MKASCGRAEVAPAGMLFVGERFDEFKLFHLGYSYG